MKAAIWDKYGPPEVLKIKEVPKPVPEDDEVLIKIHASTVTLGDCEIRSNQFILIMKIMLRLFFGLLKPRETILGQELSGEIIEVGSQVTNFAVGDQVIATPGMKFGGYAQFVALKADRKEGILIKKPEILSFEEAAAIPVGGLEALNFVGNSQLKKGESILINGAGGSIGTMSIQLAKYFGAEVTAVDRADKLDFLKKVGADHVIDYQSEDYTRLGNKYDVIVDVVGKGHYGRSVKCLNEGGRFMIANPNIPLFFKSRWTNLTSGIHVYMKMTVQNNTDMMRFVKLVEQGHIKIHIDKIYPLDRIVEAHHYVEGGNKKGNFVIKVE